MEKSDGHELIQAIKDLALEIGRTPTRKEFAKHVRGGDYRATAFGGYTVLVKAAGLETYDDRRSAGKVKIDKTIWRRDIEEHLAAYQPRLTAAPPAPYERTVFIPDVHHPFSHRPTLEKIYRFVEKEKPKYVVQVGDLYDRYSHAKFARSHNLFTPEQEDALGRKGAEEMWNEIAKAAPEAIRHQILGNHDLRPLKQILAAYPQLERWSERMLAESMTFDGVETILDPRQELILPGGVVVIHGYKSKLGEHRDHTLTNVVCGHQHVGGVVYRQFSGRVLWELNVGLAGDPEAKGLSYTPQRITKWTLGFGFLDEHGPRFIPTH